MRNCLTEVAKCDLDENILLIFDCLRGAAKYANITERKMGTCCRNKKQLNGFIYKYTDDKRYIYEHNEGDIKCPYCEKYFKTYEDLCKHIHISKVHGKITKEKFLADYKYEGIRPLCACGCGKETKLGRNIGGIFNEFVKGHYVRVVNNFSYSPESIEKSAESRRKKFADGSLVQWNKNKKWTETYNKNQIDSLMEMYADKDRNKKISDKLSGIPKSEEHKKKVRVTKNLPEAILKSRADMHNRIKNGSFSVSSKLEEKFELEFLNILGIKCKKQFHIKDINQYCDFKIDGYNILLECDGDYWHCNPDKYLNGPINKHQEDKILKDVIKNEWVRKNGFKMLRFWESDINKHPEKVINILKNIEYINETTYQ